MISKSKQAKYALLLIFCLITNVLITECCKLPGMRRTYFDDTNMNAFGTATLVPLTIAWAEPEGGIWLDRKVLVHPRFEVGLTVNINANGCNDPASHAMDGWTVILSKSQNFLQGGGAWIGYNQIYDAIVTEFDFFRNPELGDISANSISIHRCFKSNCTPNEGAQTVQRDISNQAYNGCAEMNYDISVIYNNGVFRVLLGDTTVVEIQENLATRFDNWAYLGFTGFFRGRKRELQVSGSYVCEDDYNVNGFVYQWLVGGVWVAQNTVPTISAGATTQLTISMTDVSKLIVPHAKDQNYFPWKITSDVTCGDHTGFITHDANRLITTITGCTKEGNYFVSLTTNNGVAPNIPFNIIGKGFVKLDIIGINGTTDANEASATILDTDNFVKFNWGSIKGEFSYDEVVNGLIFDVGTVDEYGNLFLMGTDLNTVAPNLDIAALNQISPIIPELSVVASGKYRVKIPIPVSGSYIVNSSKFDKSRFRYKFAVLPGRPVTAKSVCTISGYSATPTLDASANISISCRLFDQGGNQVLAQIAKDSYSVNYGCNLERVDADGEKTNEIIPGTVETFGFRCDYKTKFNGKFSFLPYFTTRGNTSQISVSLNTFYVVPTPRNVVKTQLYDAQKNVFVKLDEKKSALLTYSLISVPLTLIDFFDEDGSSFTKIGYPATFIPETMLNGRLTNSHDPAYTTKVRFEFFTLSNKRYIAVMVDDKAFIKKSSHQYQLDISLGVTSITALITYPLGSTNSKLVCIHDLSPSTTIFEPVDGLTSISAKVNTDVKIGDVILQTADSFLYNYKLADIKELVVTASPENPDTNLYVVESNVEGFYAIRLFAKIASTYKVSLTFRGVHVISNYQVQFVPLPLIDVLDSASTLNEFDSAQGTETEKHLKNVYTSDVLPEIYFKSTDAWGNTIDFMPDRNNNFLGARISLTINNNIIDVTLDQNTITFLYNKDKAAYVLTDYLKYVGKYVITVTSQTRKVLSFVYTKNAGKISTATSSASITSSKNLKIGQTAGVGVVLKDSYGNNIAANQVIGKEIANTLAVKATAADSSVLNLTFKEINNLVMRYNSEEIMKQSVYTVSVVYTDPVTTLSQVIPCADCNFFVNYDKFDMKTSKLSAVLSKSIAMSQNSILQVANQVDRPLFNFDFYDSNNNQLQYVDQTSKLRAEFEGNGVKHELVFEWIGNNQLMWFFNDSVNLKDITGGNYKLIIYFNEFAEQTYPIQFLGDGKDSDASNLPPVFDNTFFSATDIRPTAGVNFNFNIQFRTAENLRVNSYGDLTLFRFENSEKLDNKKFLVNVQFGAKKGDYIITVKSFVASSSVKPIELSIIYNGTTLKQKVLVIVKHADLSKIVVDDNNVSDRSALLLKSGKTIETYSILMTAYDQYENIFEELFDTNIFSLDRIVRLFNIQHSDAAQVSAVITTNTINKYFNLIITSRNIGTVSLSSSFMPENWKIIFLPGPISTQFTYGMFLNANSNFLTGDTATFSVFPRDAHNNVIKSDLLTADEFTSIDIGITQPKGVAQLTSPTKTKKSINDSVEFAIVLPEAGDNLFNAKVGSTVVSCVSCKIRVNISPVIFSKSRLFLGAKELKTTDTFDLDKGTFPTFSLSVYDKLDNLYSVFPTTLTVTPTFGGNESNVKFCYETSNSQLNIFVCRDAVNRNNWTYLISKSGYSLTLAAGSESLIYKLNLIGGSSDADASNGPIDVNKTFFSTTQLTAVAGTTSSFMIELRTADGKRKNFWYEKPEDNIKLSFSVVEENKYTTEVSWGEKPGQYVVKVSSTKTFTALNNNLISLTIEKKNCPNSVLFVVTPNAPESAILIDSKGVEIPRGSLPQGTADDKYILNVRLFDVYKNHANVETSSFNYNIVPPTGKESKQITSVIKKNSDLSFTITIDTVYSGTYLIASAFLGKDAYTFEISHGVPASTNTLLKVPTKATAGDNIKVYILPYDKNNNYVDPKSITTNNFVVTYKYKERVTDQYTAYQPLTSVSIEQYNEDDLGCKGCNAFTYPVQLKFRYQNYFRVTLGSSEEIKCINCVTDVSPSAMVFENSLFQRYDAVSGKFMELEDNANEDNSKTDIIYRIYPRDQFLNRIDVINDVKSYSIKLVDISNNPYFLKNQSSESVVQQYVEFVKDDDVNINGDLTYNTLTRGIYTVEINNKVKTITKSIVIIGRDGDDAASNEPIEEQNTVINEAKLSFNAGQTGYVLLEMRTINNLRKNNWNQSVEIKYQILDKDGNVLSGEAGEDKSFKSDKVRPAGVLGVFYAPVASTLSTTSLKDRKLVLQILVNGKIVTKLAPEVKVTPAAMAKASVLAEFLNEGSTNTLKDGDADTPKTFKVAAFDSFNNPTVCDPLALKLSAIGPDNSIVAITGGREVTTGFATYVVVNKLKGKYQIGSDSGLLESFSFHNKNGKLFSENTSVTNNDKTLVAGNKASITVVAKDKHKNTIAPNDVLSNFSAEVTTPKGTKVPATATVIGDTIIFSAVLTEKGVNQWTVKIDTQPTKDILFTTVTPSTTVAANSSVFCENAGGVITEYANNAILPRSNANPLKVEVSLKDKFNNIIDVLPEDVTIKSASMGGNNMAPITFQLSKTINNDKFVISVPADKVKAFNHLVTGTYTFVFTVERVGEPAYQFTYKVAMTSAYPDAGYGNGPYVIENTEMSHTSVTLFAANVFTLNLRLKTANKQYYNDDFNLESDIKHSISPIDETFTFKVQKKGRNYGDYNIEIFSSESKPDTTLKLTIKLRDGTDPRVWKDLPTILITIKPAVPPVSEKTEIDAIPSTIKADTPLTFTFKLYDKFGNIYNKMNEIANKNNLVVTNHNQIVTNAAVQLRTDGQTYEIKFVPSYPPRDCEFNIYYKDSTQQTSILKEPIITTIVSEFDAPNTRVLGSSLNEMAAGKKLDLSVMFYDRNNICLNNIENIPVFATVTGPIEYDINKRINYQYSFKLNTVTSTEASACLKSYIVIVPDHQIYNKIGTYKIVVKVGENNYEARSFNQKIVPDVIDPTKFISKYTMTGEFNPGKIPAGTDITFTVQGNDSYGNQVTSTFLNDFAVKLVNKAGKTAVSNKDNPTAFDYELNFSEGKGGIISGSLKVYKSDNYLMQYLYKGQVVRSVDTTRGPFDITVVPGVCSSKNPDLGLQNMLKATTGNPASFTITCKDRFNNRITIGGEAFKVMMTVNIEETKTSTQINTRVVDNKNGTYKVEFLPPLSGVYILTIDLRGDLYGETQRFTIKDSACPEEAPNRCPNNTEKCVKNPVECITNKGKCKDDAPFFCKVKGVDSCVVTQTACDCPTGYIRCDWPDLCVPKDKDYMCSFSLPVSCAAQFPTAPVFCKDGICRAKEEDTASQRVCPIGFVLCPDLTCRDSYAKCAIHDDCPSFDEIRCPDQSCVKDQKDCPSIVTCPIKGMFVCPDGSCVTSDVFCKPLPKCVAPNSILCPDNSCVSDIKNCPRQVACGHGFALCSDISCKTSCTK